MPQRNNPIQPMQDQKAEASARRKVVGGGVAAAVLLATPLIAKWEGKSNDPYRDIVGVTTVCYGETRVQMRRYTDAECEAMLRKAVAEFAEPVAKLTPTIAERPHQLAAAASLAYNVGIANYKSSSVRVRFLANDFKGACRRFEAWNKVRVGAAQVARYRARGEKCSQAKSGQWFCTVRGLTNRRDDETKLCLEGL